MNINSVKNAKPNIDQTTGTQSSSWLQKLKFWGTYLWEGPDFLSQALKLEWRFIVMRWLGIIIIAPGLFLFNLSHQQIIGAFVVLAIALVYNLILQYMLAKRSKLLISGYLVIFLDALLNVAMIIVAGGFDSPFYFIVYTVTVSAAMRYGYGPVLVMALLFVLSDVFEGIFFRQFLGSAFFLRSSWLILTAIIAGYLHEEAQEAKMALEEKLNQSNALNKELEAFSYSVSHDLRAPLRSIDGFSQALLEDYHEKLDDEGKDYLDRVRAASQRMAQLIDDLLDLSRVTRSNLHKENINLSDIAHSIINSLHEHKSNRNVDIKIKDDVTAFGDSRLVRVVLENLLSNAWKFTQKKPVAKIEFGTEKIEKEIVYFVRDNGDGFSMDYIDKLFGAFQRLHSMEEFEGNGIGLATVQRIIHRHGGQVWAHGEQGNGATFYFTL